MPAVTLLCAAAAVPESITRCNKTAQIPLRNLGILFAHVLLVFRTLLLFLACGDEPAIVPDPKTP